MPPASTKHVLAPARGEKPVSRQKRQGELGTLLRFYQERRNSETAAAPRRDLPVRPPRAQPGLEAPAAAARVALETSANGTLDWGPASPSTRGKVEHTKTPCGAPWRRR